MEGADEGAKKGTVDTGGMCWDAVEQILVGMVVDEVEVEQEVEGLEDEEEVVVVEVPDAVVMLATVELLVEPDGVEEFSSSSCWTCRMSTYSSRLDAAGCVDRPELEAVGSRETRGRVLGEDEEGENWRLSGREVTLGIGKRTVQSEAGVPGVR